MSIRVENINKKFGDFVALDNISLELPEGQLTALLGPSGSGKTTLLRIIAGLEQPDSGSIAFYGKDQTDQHVSERGVGFVFQHYALFKHMTVYENVAYGLTVKPRKERPSKAEIHKKVMSLLELVQLDWTANRYPNQLSGGQRQRIALARALAVEPKVLLLDEPFGALDAKVRAELRRWLRKLHDEIHVTSVFVTHDQEEALEVSDRIVVMNQGRIEQEGTPDEVYEQPATPFVYGFLGSVNLFHGRFEQHQIVVGADAIEHRDEALIHGTDVFAFARPNELEIITDVDATNGILATVTQVLAYGPQPRVELEGVNEIGQPQHFQVALPPESIKGLALQIGQRVRLVPSRLKVFERDSSAVVAGDKTT
ncbi:putative sulfate transport ATP-binding protein [Methylophaga lonarensis MPL]|uniref:Putative sulfate transport ATP-binding protein n=1 Tax=Methylophaga lonarensis MPL TaxID=1286106 RepID=M7NYE0_9GAMM|nr:sulfate ABC transporter ATP-binding protein [Methylophaga lonarensis]EMR12247.1 putative sulfate transport ATP-binding protein [Methylophaga lonarensis MPL]